MPQRPKRNGSAACSTGFYSPRAVPTSSLLRRLPVTPPLSISNLEDPAWMSARLARVLHSYSHSHAVPSFVLAVDLTGALADFRTYD